MALSKGEKMTALICLIVTVFGKVQVLDRIKQDHLPLPTICGKDNGLDYDHKSEK